MRLHVKFGTHPAEYVKALRLRKPPKVGDWLVLKRETYYGDAWGPKPRVKVDQVKDLGGGDLLYYVSG